MAEDKLEQREVNLRQWLPWTELFRGFQVAMDPKKLLLAAGGIVVMGFAWWVWAVIFYGTQSKPQWPDYQNRMVIAEDPDEAAKQKQLAWKAFRADRAKWNLLHETAGTPDARPEDRYSDLGDLAADPGEYEELQQAKAQERITDAINKMEKLEAANAKAEPISVAGKTYTVEQKPVGKMRTWPWFEERGPNPFLLATGQTDIPWETGRFGDWFLRDQFPVLIEPLVRFLTPVVYLLKPSGGGLNRLYFLLVIVSTLATWALFGGAITRMAAVQLARNEKISMREALRFVWARYLSFLMAPLFPLLFIGFIVLLLGIFGLPFMIAYLGDVVVAGLGWPIVLLAGLVMAVLLVGLVGWPMMYSTISAEGSDSFDAISRSYSYILQNPWSYAWYSLVAIAYGAVVVFFVGFMGSMMVYLGKWGVSLNPLLDLPRVQRDPSFLFVYAPTSFGWRTLLLDGAKVDGTEVVQKHRIDRAAYQKYTGGEADYHGEDQLTGFNKAGAVMVAFWLYLFFLIILGFGYSYFWTASTIIYLLMRRKVDDTDLDEIYLEEDEGEEAYPTSPAGGAAPAPPGPAGSQIMVEAPTLRSSTPAPAGSEAPAQTASEAEKPAGPGTSG